MVTLVTHDLNASKCHPVVDFLFLLHRNTTMPEDRQNAEESYCIYEKQQHNKNEPELELSDSV